MMQEQTFVGRFKVRYGETEHMLTYLIVANSQASAFELFEDLVATYVDEEAEEDGEGYLTSDGTCYTEVKSLTAVGLTTFLEMQSILPTYYAANARRLTAELLDDIKPAATALLQGLRRRKVDVQLADVLEALASSWGHKSWQVLKAKLNSAT